VIGLAKVLLGAKPFKDGNVNETYRGQVLLEDGSTRLAILKDLDNKQLANELLASVLAKSIGLPTPDVYLAEADTSALALSKGPKTSGGRVCLASIDAKAPNLRYVVNKANDAAKEKICSDLLAWAGFGSLIAFDTWVANVDRNAGNLLIGGAGVYWLIDHGHCLTGTAWGASHLKADGSYRNKMATFAKPKLSQTDRETKGLEINRSAADMHSVNVGLCRTNSRIGDFLNDIDAEAAEKFVNDRRAFVSKQSREAIGLPSLV
jgi:hypothetical protein